QTLLQGMHGLAVGYLVSSGLVSENPLVGSWAGDPVIAAGEYADPDLHEIKTGSRRNRRRNLYHLAEETFEDISYKAIAMLCEWNEPLIAEFVHRAKCNADFCLDLVLVIDRVGCKPLEWELMKEVGNDLRLLKDHLKKSIRYEEFKSYLRR